MCDSLRSSHLELQKLLGWVHALWSPEHGISITGPGAGSCRAALRAGWDGSHDSLWPMGVAGPPAPLPSCTNAAPQGDCVSLHAGHTAPPCPEGQPNPPYLGPQEAATADARSQAAHQAAQHGQTWWRWWHSLMKATD